MSTHDRRSEPDPRGGVAPGTELGGYRIESLVGRGGMGVVYRAHDLALDRDVALKLLAPELAHDVGFRERFHRESRLAASLDHPSIIPIYDAGEVAGQLYIAMRYAEGTDLKRLLAEEGRLSPEVALRLLGQVADALDAAHERGLVHRDVKPSNVLIDTRDHVYLADFGISRLVAEAGAAVSDGRTLGTVGYTSPEQIRGDDLDGRSDIYSLGCMLYECLAGRPPFVGSDTAIVFAHLEQPPPVLAGLDPVIAKALAKAPDDRHGSGWELIQDARASLRLTPTSRSRWPLAVGAVGVVLAGSVLAFALVREPGAAPSRPGTDKLLRIDPIDNQVTKVIPVGKGANGVAVGRTHLWVTNGEDGTVSRIDPTTGVSGEIPVRGTPTGVTAARDLVLVANGEEHSLVTIDDPTGAVRFVTQLQGDNAGTARVASDGRGPIYADAATQRLGRAGFDVKGPETVDPVPIPNLGDGTSFQTNYQTFGGVAIDPLAPRAAWVTGDPFARVLFRSNGGHGKDAITTVKLPFAPGLVAAGKGSVWIAPLLDDAVWRLDPRSKQLVARVRVGGPVTGLAVGGGAVWVSSAKSRTVYRIDIRTNRVVARIPTPGAPGALAAGPNDIYVAVTSPVPRVSPGVIAIGVLADCRGPYAAWYQQSLAGVELPLLHHEGTRAGPKAADGVRGARVAGKPVALSLGCTDGTAASALAEARRLVDVVGVSVVIGPTYAPQEIALQEYARRRPQVAFVNGSAGAQLLDPPPNMFSFHLDLAQSMAGLGSYAYHRLGWRRVAIVADEADRDVNWAQAAGFTAEFCSLGGKITKRVWVPERTTNYADVVAEIPSTGIDGIVATASPQTVNAVGGRSGPLRGAVHNHLLVGILGTSALGDLHAKGIPEGVPYLGTGGRRARYTADLARHFPDANAPSAFDLWYHDAMTASLSGLAAIDGDLSHGGVRLRDVLSRLTLESPLGPIRLDSDRQAVGVNSLVSFPDGRVIRRVHGVERTFGGYFSTAGSASSRTTPACVRRTPPPWAR